ncbi:MAG: right-handed parallel beta-helix repeat-containing protein [Promethearchaeota archaeon]
MNILKLLKSKIFLVIFIVIIGVLTFVLMINMPKDKTPAVTYVSGSLTEDTSWQGHIHVQNNVVVPQGVTLTVLPGTFVEFKHARGYQDINRVGLMIVGGTIRAIGTPNQQIWFTSDAEQPVNGDWGGILCANTNDSIFKYVIIEFPIIGIDSARSNVTISHSIVRWVHTEGIMMAHTTALIEYNRIYENGYHEIALEDYNPNITIQYNVFNGGNNGIYTDATNSLVRGNYFVNYSHVAIIASQLSNMSVINNKFENITGEKITNDTTTSMIISGNDFFGNGTVPIPTLDFGDPQPRPLGYVPGDPEDRYVYVYPEEDETRRVIDRLDYVTSFDWTLEYLNNSLWKFTHHPPYLGTHQNFVRINLTSGNITEYGNNKIINPNGLAYDGEYFWTCDRILYKIFKFKIIDDFIEIQDSYTYPSEVGFAYGIATDGEFIYVSGAVGSKLFKLNKSGTLFDTITLSGGDIFGTLTWNGSYFWAAGESEITRWDINGTLVGRIYPPAEATTAIAWDGKYLWTSQKSCENWTDGKIFQIEILNDQVALP